MLVLTIPPKKYVLLRTKLGEEIRIYHKAKSRITFVFDLPSDIEVLRQDVVEKHDKLN